MSRILRRPMFRGGPVDSYGTGIASGLGYARGGRIGYQNAGFVTIDDILGQTGSIMTGGQILQYAKDKNLAFEPGFKINERSKYIPKGDTKVTVDEGTEDEQIVDWSDLANYKGKVNVFEDNTYLGAGDKQGEEIEGVTDSVKVKVDTEGKPILDKEGYKQYVGTQNPIKKVDGLSDTSILNTNITADDAELSLEEIKEALGGKKAKVQDWSDAALNFFAQTQKEGATLGSALGATAEKVASKPSRTEVINKEAATFMLKDKYQTKRDKAKVELMKSQIDYKLSEGRKITLPESLLVSTKSGTTDKNIAIGIQGATSAITGKPMKFKGTTDANGLIAALQGGNLAEGDTVIVKEKITKEDGTEKTIKKIIEISKDANGNLKTHEVFNL